MSKLLMFRSVEDNKILKTHRPMGPAFNLELIPAAEATLLRNGGHLLSRGVWLSAGKGLVSVLLHQLSHVTAIALRGVCNGNAGAVSVRDIVYNVLSSVVTISHDRCYCLLSPSVNEMGKHRCSPRTLW